MAPARPIHPRGGPLFLAAALSLLTATALCATSAVTYVSATRWVDHSLEIRRALYEWVTGLLDVEAGARGFIRSDQGAFFEAYDSALTRERDALVVMRVLVVDSPTQARNVEIADHDAQRVRDHLHELVALTKAGRRDEAMARIAAGGVTHEVDAFRQDAHRIRTEEERLLAERRSDVSTGGWLTLIGALLLLVASSGLLLIAWRRERMYEGVLTRLAREARGRLEWLSDLAEALSDARTRDQVAEAVVEQGTRATGADTCALYVLDETGTALELVGHRGLSPDVAVRTTAVAETSGNSGAPGVFTAMTSGATIWAENEAQCAATHPALAAVVARGVRAFWSVPLLVENRPIGRLVAGFREPRRFSDDERAFVETLAHQCAQALMRASRTEREDEVRRWLATKAFLARAGEVLASSVDYEATLATIAQLAVPAIADWCAIHLVEPGAKFPRQVAVAHADSYRAPFERDLDQSLPSDPTAPKGVRQVIRTGKSELYTEIPETLTGGPPKSGERPAGPAEPRFESAMVVPLRGRARTFGAMTFVYAESGRRYANDDLGFAEEFARRAAMAIENASALKEAEEARAQERWLRDEAELASRSKDEFLATVSHELRTPLNAILGWTVTLRGRRPPADIDRPLAIIERNARTQAKLIEDVLDVSRIISGKLSLNLRQTSVPEAVAAAIETVSPAADAKDITIESIVSDGSLSITADPDRMQQVVWNLLSNAVKFTPRGGRISVRVFREGSEIRIRVSDTGEGIRPEVLPVIFEPFRQADASTTRYHGGLGLGLAIVRQLVSAHGGSVLAESGGPGQGATFEVQLPARSTVPAVNKASQATSAPKTSAAATDGPRLDGLRVLVIDDEHDALALVDEVLRERGAEVHLASSAAEGLEKVAVARPDVVVSDIGMPDVDGYSLMRELRARSPGAGGRTPAVALTAYARADDARRAFAAGYQMHLAKPVDPLQLVTVVANLGGRSEESP